ncbi:hypothetical protein [Paenibacillus marinisediminis]
MASIIPASYGLKYHQFHKEHIDYIMLKHGMIEEQRNEGAFRIVEDNG